MSCSLHVIFERQNNVNSVTYSIQSGIKLVLSKGLKNISKINGSKGKMQTIP